MKFSAAKIVGTPSETNWAQTFVLEPEEIEKKQTVGTIFGVIFVRDNSDNDAGVTGKQILASFENCYLNFKKENRLTLLKDILKKEIKKEETKEIEIAMGLLWKNVLYLASSKESKIILKRNEKIVTFFESSQNEDIRSASGYVEENDVLVLETSSFGNIINTNRLTEILNNNSIREIADSLAPEILNADDNSSSAAVFLRFEKEDLTIEDNEAKLENNKQEKQNPSFLKDNQFINNIKNHLDKIKKNIFSKKTLPSFPKIENKEKPKKRTLFTVAILLPFLLIGSILLNINKQQVKKQNTKIEKSLSSSKAKYEEGKSLVDLNPVRAREILEEAKKSLEDLQKDNNKITKEKDNIKTLLDQIKKSLEDATKIFKVSPQIVFDLTIVKDKVDIKKLSAFEKKLLLLDPSNNAIYLFDTENKSAEVIAGGEKTKGTTLISLYGENAYLVNPQKGIDKVNIKTKTSPEETVKKDDSWGEIIDINSFAGNIYLLDKKNKQIWKYIAGEENFSQIKNYLTEDTVPDFSNAENMNIDGSVWVLKGNGEIQKFTQGKIDNFVISGLDKEFNNPVKIFTTDETKNLYILDKGNSRVVVIGKDGVYDSQYETNLISKITDFSVNESGKKIFLVEGSKIYSIDLK